MTTMSLPSAGNVLAGWIIPQTKKKKIFFFSCSDLIKRKEGALFKELLETLDFYAGFEINEHSGVPLTDIEMTELVCFGSPILRH